MVLGLYLPGFADVLSDEPSRPEYLDNPTAFWLIAFLDLAIVAPAAIAAVASLVTKADWAGNTLVDWFARAAVRRVHGHRHGPHR
jgi:hypothetical protein